MIPLVLIFFFSVDIRNFVLHLGDFELGTLSILNLCMYLDSELYITSMTEINVHSSL